MRKTLHSTAALLALAAAAWITPTGRLVAQTTTPHLIPQSLQIEHKETLEQITMLTKHKGEVGAAARKVLALYKVHAGREDEFIFPPLTLLPYLASGKVTPDMAWALPMVDRVKAEQEQIYVEHEVITEALNQLVAAGAKTHDTAAKEFAESAVADSLNDLEILLPTVLMVGDILHSKLPAAH